MKTILNIAAGKFAPLGKPFDPYFLVNLDTMYYHHHSPSSIEEKWLDWLGVGCETFYCKADAFEFMERTKIKFNKVCIYRFLEHISMDRVLYFIYLVSTITDPGARVDVIVPNYKTLAQMILDEEQRIEFNEDFESYNIELTTELLNEPSCPHASIWTPFRAAHFWSLEGRFRIENVEQEFKFDGRDIYMRFTARRV